MLGGDAGKQHLDARRRSRKESCCNSTAPDSSIVLTR